MSKSGLLSTVLITVARACVLAQTTTGVTGVPAKWLHGGNLVVPEFNFSVHSPGSDSSWTYTELPKIEGFPATAFIASSAEDKYSVVVWEKSVQMDSVTTKGFIDGMAKSLPKEWKVQDSHYEQSAFPMSNSAKFKVTLSLPHDATMYVYEYATSGKRTYMFVNYSLAATEPPSFTTFVGSFALLDPNANVIPTKPPDTSSSILFILAICGAVYDWKYKRLGGVKPTKMDRLWFLVCVLLCVALLVSMGIRGSSAGSIGSVAGMLTVVLFAVWELGRWLIRRKNPLPPAHQRLNVDQ